MFGPFERQLHKGSDKWHKKKLPEIVIAYLLMNWQKYFEEV